MTHESAPARSGSEAALAPGRTQPSGPRRPASLPALVPASVVALAGFVLFGLGQDLVGYGLLAVGLALAAAVGRSLLRDLALVAVGLVVMSAVPVNTDVSNEHFLIMGSAMVLAVAVPYLVSRFVYRDHAIRFPWHPARWTGFEKGWLAGVVLIGYLLLPYYMVSTGVYENWPAVSDAEGIGRLFIGTNALGIWDELFFVCTCFTLLRRHLPDWQANLLQAVLFTSFLYELGFHAWAPLFIFPFAMVQGYTFKVTRSLAYVVSVHLLFDLVLFGVLVHAHNREWIDIFIY